MDNFVADAIYIDSPPERVFSALIDPQDVLVWMEAEEVNIEPREGGKFVARRFDGSRVSGTIAVLKPCDELQIVDFFWQKGAEDRGPMKLRFTLERRFEGVWITVRQEGIDTHENWQSFARATRQEWVRATVAMKRHIDEI